MGYRSLFNNDGLRARAAATVVSSAGPIRWGVDGQFWAYRDGVWTPGESEVHGRIVAALDERYRPSHAHAIRDVLRATLGQLEVRPVPRYINLGDGLLDWADDLGPRLIPHDPGFLSTVQLPIRWEDASTCDEFDEFLEQAVPADDRQRVWEILGYLMMSGNPLQKLFLLTGGGGNGKGVLMAVITAILGRRNVSSVPLADFAENQFATADVFGKLANICGDIDTTFIEKTGRIKELAGEDDVRGERKFGQPFYFDFWGKALFSANGIPASADGSRGWTRRWEIVGFPNEPAKPDPKLKDRLTTPGCLAAIGVRAVLALRGLMERGTFDHGDSATSTHARFAVRNNRVLAWIDENAYMDPSARYDRAVLYRSYRSWDNSENPGGRSMSATTFYERLEQVPGVRAVKVRGQRLMVGVRLNHDAHVVDATDDEETEGAQPGVETERLF
jgi:P4 family phage/plasmid primase-like protien